ncbi:MAG: hypothetical protein R3351_09990, partial [Nitrospirales bacterium]|nr:hypothetical protein [Nitrospirales bacterium]
MKFFKLGPQQRSIFFSILIIGLFFLSIPVSAVEYGHGYSGGQGDYSHKYRGSKGHGFAHHGKYGKGHEYGHSGHSYGRHGYGRHMGHHASASQFIQHILKFKQAMAITDEQETQLQSINTNYKKTNIKMKAEVDLANLDLHELLRNDQASLSEIETKLKNVHTLKAEMLMASIKAKREAKNVLTDE